MNIAANYSYHGYALKTELVASGRWSKYDSDNGEQAIPGWAVVNCKLTKKRIFNKFNLTVGVDNVFNKNYAVSNTYKDLTLISGSTGEVMLLNEPGRYIYANLSFVF
jgi:iron complex outermembrane receptor protein